MDSVELAVFGSSHHTNDEKGEHATGISTVPLLTLDKENITCTPDFIKKLVKVTDLPNELELFQILLEGDNERIECPVCFNRHGRTSTEASILSQTSSLSRMSSSSTVHWFSELDDSKQRREMFDHSLNDTLEAAYCTPNAVISLTAPGCKC